MKRPTRRVLISAHRGGLSRNHSLENTKSGFTTAIDSDVDFIEFDVQLTADGGFVAAHDHIFRHAGRKYDIRRLTQDQFLKTHPDPLTIQEALQMLSDSGKRAHIDIKFSTKDGEAERRLAALAMEYLPPTHMIFTSTEDHVISTLSSWSLTHAPGLLVGLSLGKMLTGWNKIKAIPVRFSELFPTRRLRRCGANLIVSHRLYARARIAKVAHKMSLPLLVWTVDSEKEMRRWLRDARVWMLTTNYPQRAHLY